MPGSLIPTKLNIPHTRSDLVSRTRLLNLLNDGVERNITLVSAPAGFGKTTLIADWVSNFHQLNKTVVQPQIAWLSLDEADNDINRFLEYFIAALIGLDDTGSINGKKVREIFESSSSLPVDSLLTLVISELISRQKKTIFVLDDYHLIDDLRIHKALNFWIDNAPAQVHTVIITREDPPVPLARLRARNHLTEVRAADLRFSEFETTQFLNVIMGLDLNPELVSRLEDRTEGWIAGLQMAALSMENRKDVVRFVENFSGTNRYILDYLLEEVLANQSEEVQRFLLTTSLLRRLTASLCDAVLKQDNRSASILAYLEHANLFLLPLDDERIWYRYHHLFADLLSARLQRTLAEHELSELHAVAASWHEQNQMIYEAIYHASLIPNDEWVERLIDQNYMEVFQRRDSASIRNWTGKLAHEVIFKRPRLAIHEANSRAWFGQLDEADFLLDVAEKRLLEQDPNPERQAMFGYLDYVKSRVTAMRGDYGHAINLCLNAAEKTPPGNQGLLGGIGVMLGYGYFLNGDFPQSEETLQATIKTGEKFGAINTTIGAYCVLARLFTIQGKLQKAYDLYQQAHRFIQKSQGQHQGAMSIIDIGFAEILYEWNNLTAAQSHITQALHSISLWSKPDDIAVAHIMNARIQQAQGDIPAAKQSIESALQVIQSNGAFSESIDTVAAAELELHLLQQNSLSVNHWVRSTEKRLNQDHPFLFENELVLINLSRAYLFLQKFDESLRLLSALETSAQAAGRTGRLLKICILQALLYTARGENTNAFVYLKKALSLAEPEGYVRAFINEGPPMQQLLSQWSTQFRKDPLTAFAMHLIAQFDEKTSLSPDGQVRRYVDYMLIEPLSPREIEVLRLIALGKTNKEISLELVVSPGTVKAHTSNIYRKLDVSNRTEAVARARSLELLS